MADSWLRIIASLFLAVWLLVAPFNFAWYGPRQTAASDGIQVVESSASHSFAQQITFTLQATSGAEITHVYLFFRAEGDGQTYSDAIDIDEPSQEINVSYSHDLRRSPLLPFATVTFWWQIEDATGQSLNTASDPDQFEYTDNRFQWNALSAEGITIHWIEGQGDPVFGQAALDIALASVEEINAELGAPVPKSIRIYIYDTQPNLDRAMALTGREWVVGQAHPELGVVLVTIPPDSGTGYKWRMRRYIPHEITHLLVYQAVGASNYSYVPEWLDEGLATANEQLPTPEHALVLEDARAQGQLIPLQSLCVSFEPNPQTAFLAYAQSGSLVRFIREWRGASGIRGLLTAYANGASCTSGVLEALNIEVSDLEAAWLASLAPEQETEQEIEQETGQQAELEPQAQRQVEVEEVGFWVSLSVLGLLLAVSMIGGGLHPEYRTE